MALPDILETLRLEAEAEIANIVRKRDQELADIKTASDAFVSEVSSEAKVNRERRAEKVAERILAKARHEAVFLQTGQIRANIEAVFTEALEQLKGLSDAEYNAFLKKQWETLPKLSEAEFQVAEERKEATADFLKSHKVPASHIKSVSGLFGGFVAISTDLEYDCSFAKIIDLLHHTEVVTLSKKIASK